MMNLKLVLTTILLYTYLNIQAQHRFVCNYNTSINNTGCDVKNLKYSTDAQVIRAVNSILKPLGLPAHFILLECPNMSNAIAITGENGKRYILYDREFMQAIADNSTDWSKISILAHEIGHHLSGHTLKEFEGLASQRQQELEADEFSGFILKKLGASLSQAQQSIRLLCTNDDDTYMSHPSLNKRLLAIAKGFNNASNSQSNTVVSVAKMSNSVEDYFYKGNIALENSNYDLAILYYNQAIAIDPQYGEAYINRSKAKKKLGDDEGASEDMIEGAASEINKRYTKLYNRALMEDSKELAKASKTSISAENIVYKGVAEANLKKDYNLAIVYYNQAISTDPNYIEAYFQRGRAKSELKDYQGAIEDFTRVISTKPNDPNAYISRGYVKSNTRDYQGAIEDFTQAIAIDASDANTYMNRGHAKYNLKDYQSAIEDFTKAIILKPTCANYYDNRGKSNLCIFF